jgi:hypothetical protein
MTASDFGCLKLGLDGLASDKMCSPSGSSFDQQCCHDIKMGSVEQYLVTRLRGAVTSFRMSVDVKDTSCVEISTISQAVLSGV